MGTYYMVPIYFSQYSCEMNNYLAIPLTLYILCSGLICTVKTGAVEKCKLIALNDSLHTLKLHQQLGNKDGPSRSDLAFKDARVRKRICQDIFETSGYFQRKMLYGIEMAELYEKLSHTKKLNVDQIFKNKKYSNPYKQRQFHLWRLNDVEEYVFVCFLRHWWTGSLISFYVSKEYNLNLGREPFKPGRFIFGQFVPGAPNNSFNYMILAEEPTELYTEPDDGFNVELDYLNKRKYSSPANGNDTDPLCKLISDELFDLNDQHYRLCVAVLRSSSYKDLISYPKRDVWPCWTKRITFRTPEGKREAADGEYFERVTLCHSTYVNPDLGEMVLYISRAYESNRIFVYRYNVDDSIYLENLSTNINVVEENYYFYDFLEE